MRSSRPASDSVARAAGDSAVWQRLAVAVALLVVALTVLAVPARSYLAQRTEIASRSAELSELERQNQELVTRRDRLEDPEEIKAIARRDYGLVLEGEESYTILPPATAGLILPRVWPFDRLIGPMEQAATAPS